MTARALIAAVLGGWLAGCATPGYLAQAARGQVDLLQRSRPIVSVLADTSVPLHVRRVLSRVPELNAFARAQGLTPARSYERYAALDREAVVWVVQACAPLSFDERRWSFPLVGSVPYLGFFDRAQADALASKLAAEEGLDVYVRGAGAYSTLGWFDDPVLSTMISAGPEAMGDFANVVLHESVHATVYVPGQSSFNESLASFVADRLTVDWLEQTFGEGAPLARVWLRSEERHRASARKLREAWEKLDALYGSPLTDGQKLERKAQLLSELQESLGTRRLLNNAMLAGYRTYATGGDGFERLFSACGGRWDRFLDAIRSLEAKDFPGPQAEELEPVLDALAARRCPPQ